MSANYKYDRLASDIKNKMGTEIKDLTSEADYQIGLATVQSLDTCSDLLTENPDSFGAYEGCKKPFNDEIDEINQQLKTDTSDIKSKCVDKWGIGILDK